MFVSARTFFAAAALLGALWSGAHARSLEINPDSVERVPAITISRVSQFLERFIDSSRRAEEQIDLYTDDVDYFGRGQVSKAEILRDMKRYRRQWPSRDYRISRIDLIYPDPKSDSVYVRYELEFTVANSANAKRISGRGLYGAVIEDIGGTPQIASIQESVFARRRSQDAGR